MKNEWISVKDRLPEFDVDVITYQPPAKQMGSEKLVYDRVIVGHLFTLEPGERSGWISKKYVHDGNFPLREGGIFWGYPYICHQNFVTHWMPLPEPPKQ